MGPKLGANMVSVAIITLLISGCANSESTGLEESTVTGTSPVGSTDSEVSASVEGEDPFDQIGEVEQVASIDDSASTAQLEAEYRVAVESAKACAEEQGVVTSEIEVQTTPNLFYSYGIFASAEDIDALSIINDICNYQYRTSEYELLLERRNAPQGAEREALFAEYLKCLEDNGIDTTGIVLSGSQDDPVSRVFEHVDTTGDSSPWDCLDQYHYRIYPDGSS